MAKKPFSTVTQFVLGRNLSPTYGENHAQVKTFSPITKIEKLAETFSHGNDTHKFSIVETFPHGRNFTVYTDCLFI